MSRQSEAGDTGESRAQSVLLHLGQSDEGGRHMVVRELIKKLVKGGPGRSQLSHAASIEQKGHANKGKSELLDESDGEVDTIPKPSA